MGKDYDLEDLLVFFCGRDCDFYQKYKERLRRQPFE